MEENVISWHGLPTQRFEQYKSWINNENPGACGTYTAGVLLHDFLYTHYQLDFDKSDIIEGLRPVVDLWLPYRGTFIHDIVHGLRFMLANVSHVCVNWNVFAERQAVSLLSAENPVPIIVGTNKWLGSRYKNHWVLAYQYGYDTKGDLWLKVYDNHGHYDSVINIKETLSCIWLEDIAQ